MCIPVYKAAESDENVLITQKGADDGINNAR